MMINKMHQMFKSDKEIFKMKSKTKLKLKSNLLKIQHYMKNKKKKFQFMMMNMKNYQNGNSFKSLFIILKKPIA